MSTTGNIISTVCDISLIIGSKIDYKQLVKSLQIALGKCDLEEDCGDSEDRVATSKQVLSDLIEKLQLIDSN